MKWKGRQIKGTVTDLEGLAEPGVVSSNTIFSSPSWAFFLSFLFLVSFTSITLQVCHFHNEEKKQANIGEDRWCILTIVLMQDATWTNSPTMSVVSTLFHAYLFFTSRPKPWCTLPWMSPCKLQTFCTFLSAYRAFFLFQSAFTLWFAWLQGDPVVQIAFLCLSVVTIVPPQSRSFSWD